jgi:hypothetical protein
MSKSTLHATALTSCAHELAFRTTNTELTSRRTVRTGSLTAVPHNRPRSQKIQLNRGIPRTPLS